MGLLSQQKRACVSFWIPHIVRMGTLPNYAPECWCQPAHLEHICCSLVFLGGWTTGNCKGVLGGMPVCHTCPKRNWGESRSRASGGLSSDVRFWTPSNLIAIGERIFKLSLFSISRDHLGFFHLLKTVLNCFILFISRSFGCLPFA